MRFTILTDNRPGTDPRLQSEHGLSLYFEAAGKKILLDTGASSLYAENAAVLGIDLSQVDLLILSHAHADHTGGLRDFLERNTRARIYLSGQIGPQGYFSTRRTGQKRDISIDWSCVEAHPERFIAVNGDQVIASSPVKGQDGAPGDGTVVSLITDIPTPYPQPKANATLLCGDAPDRFGHEIAVRVDTPEGTVLLSSCSHLGLLNTLSACGGTSVRAYVGGLHLVDSDESHQFETGDDLKAICDVLDERFPELEIWTGHCTGPLAYRSLEKHLGHRIHVFCTGKTFEIN